MEICNGGYPWSFTDGDAFIQYRKQKPTFNFDLWYMPENENPENEKKNTYLFYHIF
jgi:hypothetical protein